MDIKEAKQRLIEFLNTETDTMEENWHVFRPEEREEANRYHNLLISLASVLQNT